MKLSLLIGLLSGLISASSLAAEPGKAVFTDVGVTAHTSGVRKGASGTEYENPILPGFYPDPSIEQVGDDYYLINSTFAFYPGIPVFHSKNLVDWTQIGNAIDRPGMLDFSGLSTSRGVFAPDISHHDGLFYIINTCVDCGGNFVITAKDPKGPWSDPVWLPFGGIDPSIFWDEDGKAWIVWNDAPEGEPLYNGHRAIWMQGFDPKTLTMTGTKHVVVNGGADISQKPVWVEGPHIYKVNGRYYLMCAEGGTAEDHSEVIFSSDRIDGPYVPYDHNPILTQRDLNPTRTNPVTSAGHADLIETPKGWHAVFLATRPYEGNLYNTGRETFMLPVTWTADDRGIKWPVILDKGAAIPQWVKTPTRTKIRQQSDWRPVVPNLDAATKWLTIRTPKTPFLSHASNVTTLAALPEALGDVTSHPAFIGLRQSQSKMAFGAKLDFTPVNQGDRAGIAAVQNDEHYLFFGFARRNGETVIEVTRRNGGQDPRDGVVIAALPAPPTGGELRIILDGGKAQCLYMTGSDQALMVAEDVDITGLSTAKAGGFVGTIIGLYAYGQTP